MSVTSEIISMQYGDIRLTNIVGAYTYGYMFHKNNHTESEDKVRGLFITRDMAVEEALNKYNRFCSIY